MSLSKLRKELKSTHGIELTQLSGTHKVGEAPMSLGENLMGAPTRESLGSSMGPMSVGLREA